MYSETEEEYESCEYCEGTCDCPRCVGMDYITKAMGFYLSHSENYEEAANRIIAQFKFEFYDETLKIKPCLVLKKKKEKFLELIK